MPIINIKKYINNEVFHIKRSSFSDNRGTYIETFNLNEFKKNIKDIDFVEDDISTSKKNVLRGIHGNFTTWKLVSCLYGKFEMIVLDYRNGSKTFGQWQKFVLSPEDFSQILVPPGFGNGHLVLSDWAVFHYKQSEYYNPSSQFTVSWRDERFDFKWSIDKPILSERDNI